MPPTLFEAAIPPKLADDPRFSQVPRALLFHFASAYWLDPARTPEQIERQIVVYRKLSADALAYSPAYWSELSFVDFCADLGHLLACGSVEQLSVECRAEIAVRLHLMAALAGWAPE